MVLYGPIFISDDLVWIKSENIALFEECYKQVMQLKLSRFAEPERLQEEQSDSIWLQVIQSSKAHTI